MTQKDKHFYHVTPSKTDHKWRVKEVGSTDEPKVYDTQKEAVNGAEKLAKKISSEGHVKAHVVIHDEHGHFKVVENF